MCGALPYLHPECWQLLAASSPLCVCPPPSPKKCFSRSPSCPRRRGAGPPPALTLTLTPTHRTHIWAHFQVDFLLVVVPQLLGGLGLLGDVGFLGVLDEVRVVFPLPGGEGGSVTDVASKRGAPLSPPPCRRVTHPAGLARRRLNARVAPKRAGGVWDGSERVLLGGASYEHPLEALGLHPWGSRRWEGGTGTPLGGSSQAPGGGFGGSEVVASAFSRADLGESFSSLPFPPLPSNRSPLGGFPHGWHPAGGGSVLPAHLNLARFLSNSCFSRWKSWMYFIWGQRGGRGGLSARGRGTQTPTALLPPMGAPQPWDRPYSSGFPPQSPASIPRAAPEGHQPWVRGHRGFFSAAGDKPSPGGGSWGNQAPSPHAHGAGM